MIEKLSDSIVSQVVLPSSWLSILCKEEGVFKMSFGADPAALFKFWDGLYTSDEGHKFWMEHPQLKSKTPRDLVHTLPLAVHEDAGPFSKTKSMVEVFFQVCSGRAMNSHANFLPLPT